MVCANTKVFSSFRVVVISWYIGRHGMALLPDRLEPSGKEYQSSKAVKRFHSPVLVPRLDGAGAGLGEKWLVVYDHCLVAVSGSLGVCESVSLWQ